MSTVQDTDLELCAHISVDYDPYQCEDGGLHEQWVCRDCGLPFTPEGDEDPFWEEKAREVAHTLSDVIHENQRLRVAILVLGAFGMGWLLGR